jgi:hypothetical protein
LNKLLIHRQMAISREEFLRTLPLAAGRGRVEYSEAGVVIRDGARLVDISLQQETDTVIASLRLPRLEVKLFFSGYKAQLAAAFMADFDRAFHRGGG